MESCTLRAHRSSPIAVGPGETLLAALTCTSSTARGEVGNILTYSARRKERGRLAVRLLLAAMRPRHQLAPRTAGCRILPSPIGHEKTKYSAPRHHAGKRACVLMPQYELRAHNE